MISELKIGSLIQDNGKIGVVTNIIEQGKWSDGGPLNFSKNFEINYPDGETAVLPEHSIKRLIDAGKIIVLVY